MGSGLGLGLDLLQVHLLCRQAMPPRHLHRHRRSARGQRRRHPRRIQRHAGQRALCKGGRLRGTLRLLRWHAVGGRQHWQQVLEEELLYGVVGLAWDAQRRGAGEVGLEGRGARARVRGRVRLRVGMGGRGWGEAEG